MLDAVTGEVRFAQDVTNPADLTLTVVRRDGDALAYTRITFADGGVQVFWPPELSPPWPLPPWTGNPQP